MEKVGNFDSLAMETPSRQQLETPLLPFGHWKWQAVTTMGQRIADVWSVEEDGYLEGQGTQVYEKPGVFGMGGMPEKTTWRRSISGQFYDRYVQQ